MLKGTQDQPSLGEGFDTVESSTSVGQLITRDSPATFSITDPNADRARVIISYTIFDQYNQSWRHCWLISRVQILYLAE